MILGNCVSPFRNTGARTSYSAEATALFNYVGDIHPSTKTHIDNLILSFKSTGVWSQSSFFCIMMLPTLNALKYLVEIKSLTVLSTMRNSGTFSDPYNTVDVFPNVSEGISFKNTGYVTSGFIPSNYWTLNSSCKIMCFTSDGSTGSSYDSGAVVSASQSSTFTRLYTGTLANGDMYGTTVGTGRVQYGSATGVKGVYIQNRNASNYHELVLNDTVLDSRTGNQGSIPNIEEYINCQNTNGTAGTKRPAGTCTPTIYMACDGLSTGTRATLSTALQTYLTNMQKKQVYTKQIVFNGNSHGTYYFQKKFRTIQYNTLLKSYKYTSLAVSGRTTTQMLSAMAAELAPLYNAGYTRNIHFIDEMTNDLYAQTVKATAVSTVETNIANYCTTAVGYGFEVYVGLMAHRTYVSNGSGMTQTEWNLAVDACNEYVIANYVSWGCSGIYYPPTGGYLRRSDYGSDAAFNTAISTALADTTIYQTDSLHFKEPSLKVWGDNITSVTTF